MFNFVFYNFYFIFIKKWTVNLPSGYNMEKRIKIRFIERGFGDGNISYSIQRRTWYIYWVYIGWTQDMGYGSVFNCYSDTDKNKLLDDVIKYYYGLDKDIVRVIEYPSIKIY